MIFKLVQFLGLALIVLFLITQIALPILKGRRLFPIFDKRKNEARKKLIDLNEEIDIMESQDQILKRLFDKNKNHQSN